MNKKNWAIIIIALLGINIYTLVSFYNYKKQSVLTANSLLHNPDELNAFKVNFSTAIENGGMWLKDIAVKDSLNNIISLQDFFKNGQHHILVCRFSETNCESCVNYSILTLLQQIDAMGKENVLFLGSYRNNRIFNKQKILYGIDKLNVANAATLNLQAENIGYPYYFTLDSTLQVSNVFVPDKGVSYLANRYLKLIQNRYFPSV
jgi:hypothetical protein